MAFEPFGYRFDIESPLPPPDLKDAIRARRKSWFDAKSGARGWMAGPFICLWMSAFDRNGPMLFGRIREEGFGTRIGGRAGSDLNGLAMLALMLPVMAYLFLDGVTTGAPLRHVAVLGVILFAGGVAIWMSHKDRKSAEPLVRFLRDVAAPGGGRRDAGSSAASMRAGLCLIVSGAAQDDAVTPARIHDALMDMGPHDAIVLQSRPDHYVQAGIVEDGFIVEKREGSHLRHYRAVRSAGDAQGIFTLEETRVAFLAYAGGEEMPRAMTWARMDMPAPSGRPA